MVGIRGKVEVVLLDVLAVVSLTVSEPEEPLLENGVLAVPGISVFAVILAHRPPLSFAQVGSPFFSGNILVASIF